MLYRRFAVTVIGPFVAVVIAGCGGGSGPAAVTVGSSPDADSALLAHLYAAALRYYGSAARVEPSPDPLAGLDAASVSGVVPELTGRVLQRLQPDAVARSDAQVYRDMVSSLPEGVAAGDYTTSAEDKPALAVTDETVAAWGGRDVTAVTRNCGKVVAGAVVAAARPPALGTCKLPKPREFADEAKLFAALQSGQINAAWTSTAAPDIPSELVILADRTGLIRAENVVPLYRRNELTESQVLAVNEIAGVLDTGALADMRRQIGEGRDPAAVAEEWLAGHPLGR